MGQTATSQYAIHLYKDYAGTTNRCTIEWEGRTNCPPSLSTVYLQIYNFNTAQWETIDSDNTTLFNTDFVLTADLTDLTDYKDPNSFIVCRVYQLDI